MPDGYDTQIAMCACGKRAHHEVTMGVIFILEEMIEQVELYCGAPACKARLIAQRKSE